MEHEPDRSVDPQETAGGDRVREHTRKKVLHEMDAELRQRVADYVGRPPEEISHRIHQVESESDMERILEGNAAVLSLIGLALGRYVDRRFVWLTGGVLAFLLQHAIQGWCPPVIAFRQMGVRTRQEIDAEKYALKALRGDFASLPSAPAEDRLDKALRAAGSK